MSVGIETIKQKKSLIAVGVVITLLLIFIVIRHFFLADKASHSMPVAIGTPVTVVEVSLADVPVYIDALGTVNPNLTITVVTQIDGILLSTDFIEGQQVKKGQVIARIDARQIEAQLEEAKGILARDQAILANDEINLARYRKLFQAGSVTRQTLDNQIALVKQDEGTVQADLGNVANLEVQLSYTTITSPVDGVIGFRQVDPGNYVTASTPIAVITQLDPVSVVYAVPEDYIGQIHQAMANGDVPVLAYDRDKKTLLATGVLAGIDNQVNVATGTINVKANFDHTTKLFPNQFVNVRMQASRLHQIPVVPTVAIQSGVKGNFIFVIGPENRVTLRYVKSGPVDGNNTAILDGGVQVGEKVVTDGADRLDNNSLVRVVK